MKKYILKPIQDYWNAFRSLYLFFSANSAHNKQRIFGWLAAGIAVILLYFSLRGINWNDSVKTIRDGDYRFLPVLVIWASISDIFRAFRWRILLQVDQKLKIPPVFWANMVGYFGNMTLPARAGEALRSFYLGNEAHLSSTFVFATCMVERIIDLIILVMIGSLAVLTIGSLPPMLLNALQIMAFAGALALIVLIIFPIAKPYLTNLVEKFSFSEKTKQAIDIFY